MTKIESVIFYISSRWEELSSDAEIFDFYERLTVGEIIEIERMLSTGDTKRFLDVMDAVSKIALNRNAVGKSRGEFTTLPSVVNRIIG